MIPVNKHLPLDFCETTSGIANVDRVTAAPKQMVRLHQRACWYMVISAVLLILAIALFVASAQGSERPLLAQPTTPAAAPAADDQITAYGLGILCGFFLTKIAFHDPTKK